METMMLRYLYLSEEPVKRTFHAAPGVLVDVDEDGHAVGIEILGGKSIRVTKEGAEDGYI